MDGNPFLKIQSLGRALMLPIAVLPVAGILLRFGQSDMLNIKIIADAGGAIFDNLPLLFAIGIAVGFAKDNNGVAALAGALGYLVEIAVMKDINDKLNMGVLSGVVAGVVAGMLYNRFKDIKLPEFLAFFGGKRFVPIITGLVCLGLGVIFGYAWGPVQAVIDSAGHWLTTAGAIGTFVYGLLNRLLLVTGLHHILNSLVWFVFGTFTPAGGAPVTGDLHRFFAGDPTAGGFMAGFFPVMMFGLPAACLAMLHEAPKEKRAMVGGLLLSMALTSFLTGVTEPIEFTFMFLAPVLYGIHAVLTGLSLAICSLLNIKLGFTFSAGAIDYFLNYGLSTHGWEAIPLGVVYAVVYYGLFRFFIRRFNLPTPGREASAGDTEIASSMSGVAVAGGAPATRAARYIDALGGAANLKVVDACTTRLRLNVVDPAHVSEPALKAIGARGVLKRGGESVQVIIGPEADIIADEIRREIASGRPAAAAAAAPVAAAAVASAAPAPTATANQAGPLDPDPSRWLSVLGGTANVVSLDAIAATRLRVIVRDPSAVDRARLGTLDVVWVSTDTLHIVVGNAAQRYADELSLQSA
ncbi:PTS system N-acetylglucosamine-specific IIB component (Glc family) /PTS system N-acetylglucosamine-specific IIC component (Glc family) [Paraburkholderia eburnea]|uniref:PTS system N-acetylglucosamine-specific IIB component (Glc family) /PTS system N-acetylglucosamine-specific IIC component (Glc family) n=1 Tax=Paraburkholderia eburnea TaxID=1189126 RepID=A0A2S4MNH8_9BURK|nr:N-acetylglucosamine-specific PTS transporter subunit IIBC [Paraburkholderia eburnea]POR56251.1 PTS system N-acetylglucosamine-specific IIB component (Glc family) /PTS system N-acetylglucosamine-specific IIC component (Glc family) [Paraburkholderia eburnea]PRZ27378.1 PTS system N-acetylglucosamine-specific IIB component (Glc family) /PTS system N-acetylglucosamine-specific IIC component (Glc family) [Paraburkholderia eburnea]